jgi:hypothetical protein
MNLTNEFKNLKDINSKSLPILIDHEEPQNNFKITFANENGLIKSPRNTE